MAFPKPLGTQHAPMWPVVVQKCPHSVLFHLFHLTQIFKILYVIGTILTTLTQVTVFRPTGYMSSLFLGFIILTLDAQVMRDRQHCYKTTSPLLKRDVRFRTRSAKEDSQRGIKRHDQTMTRWLSSGEQSSKSYHKQPPTVSLFSDTVFEGKLC